MSTLCFIAACVLIAPAAAFAILFIGKTGIRDAVIQKAPKLVSQMFACDFCLSFWTCSALAAVITAVTGALFLVAVPIVAAPITRRLI